MSESPYDSLNLGRSTGDDPARIARNRKILEHLVGSGIAYMTQVHGSHVEAVETPTEEPEADALVTETRGLALAVLVADCVPLLMHDRSSGRVAVVHAGRRGVAHGIVQRTVHRLVASGGGNPMSIEAAIGPAICGRCYEVPDQMRSEVSFLVPQTWAVTSWGTPALDLRAGVEAQLKESGVESISLIGGCTFEDAELFSHRRDGATGRVAGVIVCAR